MPSVEVVSVNVGLPAVLGMRRGKEVRSGIVKKPVEAEELFLDHGNLEGDAQADLEVHGGPDKAVYAYPAKHLRAWGEEWGQALAPGAFGENLTVAGCDEDSVCVGDRWAWGDAILEVCQPRWPCFKLAMLHGRSDVIRRMRDTGRTGWYMRVIRPGRVPVAGPIEVVKRHPMGATVSAVHWAAIPGDAPEEVLWALVHLEPLAESWRKKLAALLASGPRP